MTETLYTVTLKKSVGWIYFCCLEKCNDTCLCLSFEIVFSDHNETILPSWIDNFGCFKSNLVCLKLEKWKLLILSSVYFPSHEWICIMSSLWVGGLPFDNWRVSAVVCNTIHIFRVKNCLWYISMWQLLFE